MKSEEELKLMFENVKNDVAETIIDTHALMMLLGKAQVLAWVLEIAEIAG
jgi:TRAP-type C4-dicarboxylate transport system permease large subunit